MEAIAPERRTEMLAEYQRLRQIGLRLNTKLVQSLAKGAIDEAGRRLGILKRGVLVFDTEDTIAVLMDYAIRHIRRDGKNAIERYLVESPPPPDSEEMRWLQSLRPVRYGLLQVEECFPGFGLRANDLLRNEQVLLIDLGFSQSAVRGAVIASHIYTLGDYWMTTGAALPIVEADVLERLLFRLGQTFGETADAYRRLSPEQETELATLAIRTCLDEGMSQRVRYEDGPSIARHGPHALPGPTRQRVGRNEPCPCGSGRKFKNCCRR